MSVDEMIRERGWSHERTANAEVTGKHIIRDAQGQVIGEFDVLEAVELLKLTVYLADCNRT